MYDHTKQYRCPIIRGKSQSEMDNFLPLYAKIIDGICPCDVVDFKSAFDTAMQSFLGSTATQKTLDNHRTENARQLFGMYYIDKMGIVYASERTLKFLADGDTPALFKDICYKMQFPNGSQKYDKLQERLDNKLKIRQFPFILKVMLLAKSNQQVLTKKEIGCYILNSLDVLQGNASPLEVYDAIVAARNADIERSVGSGSNATQHINEQINLLEFANLVIIDGQEVNLNPREMLTIQLFAEKYADDPLFDVYSYDLSTAELRKQFYLDWNIYFSKLSDVASAFETTVEALGAPEEIVPTEDTGTTERIDTTAIGDEGERFVYEYERNRVASFNPRLVGKVIHLGKTRGLGYDIQSVVAKPCDNPDFVKYIEVKATKRVTIPSMEDDSWFDTLNITRNEWVAAQQHKDSYSIFRVYFVRNAVVMYILENIAQKSTDGIIAAVPTMYRVDFGRSAVDEVIRAEGGVTANA